MITELDRLRDLRDFLLGYTRSEIIRDDYWDVSEEEHIKEYLEEAIRMAERLK